MSRGCYKQLKKEFGRLTLCPTSRKVRDSTLEFIRASEKQLKSLKMDGLRISPSTEVLESVFGRYKQLERQHSHGGFTSLLATFPTLLRPTTAEDIEKSFARISTKDMRAWVQENLGTTLHSKKNQAYAEYKIAMQT